MHLLKLLFYARNLFRVCEKKFLRSRTKPRRHISRRESITFHSRWHRFTSRLDSTALGHFYDETDQNFSYRETSRFIDNDGESVPARPGTDFLTLNANLKKHEKNFLLHISQLCDAAFYSYQKYLKPDKAIWKKFTRFINGHIRLWNEREIRGGLSYQPLTIYLLRKFLFKHQRSSFASADDGWKL